MSNGATNVIRNANVICNALVLIKTSQSHFAIEQHQHQEQEVEAVSHRSTRIRPASKYKRVWLCAVVTAKAPRVYFNYLPSLTKNHEHSKHIIVTQIYVDCLCFVMRLLMMCEANTKPSPQSQATLDEKKGERTHICKCRREGHNKEGEVEKENNEWK